MSENSGPKELRHFIFFSSFFVLFVFLVVLARLCLSFPASFPNNSTLLEELRAWRSLLNLGYRHKTGFAVNYYLNQEPRSIYIHTILSRFFVINGEFFLLAHFFVSKFYSCSPSQCTALSIAAYKIALLYC